MNNDTGVKQFGKFRLFSFNLTWAGFSWAPTNL